MLLRMADDAAKTKRNDREMILRIIALFKPHHKMVWLTVAAVLVGVILGILPPYFIKAIIDEGIAKQDLGVIGFYSLLTLTAVLAGAGMTLVYGYLGVIIGQRIMCTLRQKLFDHLQGMSLRFFTSTRTGEIQTRLISDVQGVQTVVSTTLVDQLSNIAIVLSTLTAMFLMDWRLTLLSIVLVPLFMLIGNAVGEYARKVRQGTQEQTAELNAMMQETLSVSGILLTKAVGRQGLLSDRFDSENQKLAVWQIKSNVVQYLFFGMIRLITQLAPTLVYWLAGWLLIVRGDQTITIGMLVAFTGLQIRLFFPLTGLFGAQVEIMGSFALFQRIFEYLDYPRDISNAPDAKPIPADARGKVEFKDVCFKYDPESEHLTVDHTSFVAEPGHLIALVGPSGAGKTTLTYLIPRLYDADSGQVLIDGVDVKDLRLEDLSRMVGMVTQETYLMHTTVAENLRIAKPEATLEELQEACKLAAIHDHIMTLEHKYDTVVGERGYKLSGGEKQRLAIARAILKNPKILILDEATSALDTRSERLIQESMSQLMKGRTTFAIAHRLSTIIFADQILVLERGRIVERGRHEELLKQNGLYARLYEEQFSSQRAEQATEPVSSNP